MAIFKTRVMKGTREPCIESIDYIKYSNIDNYTFYAALINITFKTFVVRYAFDECFDLTLFGPTYDGAGIPKPEKKIDIGPIS